MLSRKNINLHTDDKEETMICDIAYKIRNYLFEISNCWSVDVSGHCIIECLYKNCFMFSISRDDDGAWCVSGKDVRLETIRDISKLLEV